MAKTSSQKPRRSSGKAKEPGAGMLPNGKPDLSPTAGYAGNEPVQYPDESNEQFALRVADFESRRANAAVIESGGRDYDAKRTAIKARHDAELAALDLEEEAWNKSQKPSSKKGK